MSRKESSTRTIGNGERHYRRMTDYAPAMMWECAPDGRRMGANRFLHDFLGGPLEDHGGWLDRMHPEDRARCEARFAEALAAQAPLTLDYRLRRYDGEFRRVVDSGEPVHDAQGEFRGFAGFCVDVSEVQDRTAAFKAGESCFRLLAETAPCFVWTAAPNGAVTSVNARWMEFCGLAPEPNPKRWPELAVHPDDLPRQEGLWRRAIGEGRDFDLEVRYRRADGMYRWFLTRIVAHRDEDGRILRWIGVSTDIHMQKQLHEHLREDRRRRDEFIAALGHELRNPLAAICNAAQILQKQEPMKPEVDFARDAIERQARVLSRLVDELLELPRITRGHVSLRSEDVNLSDAIRGALEAAQPLYYERRQRLTVSPLPARLMVRGDALRLTQIVAALLDNAARYTPAGGRVELLASDANGNAVVDITDSGVGVPPAMLERIFEPFVQLNPTSAPQGGLGIGLAVAQQLAQLHGGRIEAHSEGPGSGSRFTLCVPLAVREPLSAPPDEAPRVGAVRRVLVVDDNQDAARMLGLLLNTLGCQVMTVHAGAEALAQAEAFHPDTVLLDIGMPEMDGYTVARRLREQPYGKALQLVAVTGWSEADPNRSRGAGFDGHLVKPVNAETLKRLFESGMPPS